MRALLTLVAALAVLVVVGGALTSPSGCAHKPHDAHKTHRVITRGKAARAKEQQPSPEHAPLPKGDKLEGSTKRPAARATRPTRGRTG
jgi:hypothetical protein